MSCSNILNELNINLKACTNEASKVFIYTHAFTLCDSNGDQILSIKLLDDKGNIHLETQTDVYDGPVNLLFNQ